MELPIGIRGQAHGVPWLATLLIIACAGLAVHDWRQRDARQAEISAARAAVLAYFQERPYLDLDAAGAALVWPDDDASAREDRIARLRREYPFRVIELQRAMDQPELDRLRNALAAAVDRQLTRRFGFAPASPAPAGWIAHMFLENVPARLVANLLFLFLAGCALECLWPRAGFALLFVASGVASAGALRVASPDATMPVVGMGGALAGLMGAVLARWPFATLELGKLAVPALVLPIGWLLADLAVLAPLGRAPAGAGPSHLAGFGLGVVFALALRVAGLERPAPAPGRARAGAEPSDPAARLRRDVQAGRLDQALEQLDSIEPGSADPLVLVRLGTRLAQGGRGEDGLAVLRRVLPDPGGSLAAPIALRFAREVQPLDAELAARAAQCGLADPGLDDALRAQLEPFAGAGSPAPPPPAPELPPARDEGALEAFEHGVVDLSTADGEEDEDAAPLETAAGGGDPLAEFDVNDLATTFDFDEGDDEKPELD